MKVLRYILLKFYFQKEYMHKYDLYLFGHLSYMKHHQIVVVTTSWFVMPCL